MSKNTDTVLNFSYLAITLPSFKSVNKKLPELESRVSHSFDIKLVSRKKAFKSFGVPSNPLPVKCFCFKISFCIWDITILFSLIQSFTSIHIANNLILAISFGFKLNSNRNFNLRYSAVKFPLATLYILCIREFLNFTKTTRRERKRSLTWHLTCSCLYNSFGGFILCMNTSMWI